MKFDEITTGVGNNFSCIYCWTNLINGKKYIGQTQRFYDRMSRYRGGHFNPHMKSAIEKYVLNCWKPLKANILQHRDEISSSVNV